ncbi:MAG: hypothetical protein WBD27_03400 [Pyrinomonadaceae bacterium]
MVDSKTDLRIPEDRPLSAEETKLVRWALEHSLPGSDSYLSQLDKVRVISRCGCGCASVDFSFDGVLPDYRTGLQELSDHLWGTGGIDLCGIFVFARSEKLAGFEVWSVDGQVTPTELPKIEDLRDYSEEKA